jgi:hypothetical protein
MGELYSEIQCGLRNVSTNAIFKNILIIQIVTVNSLRALELLILSHSGLLLAQCLLLLNNNRITTVFVNRSF